MMRILFSALLVLLLAGPALAQKKNKNEEPTPEYAGALRVIELANRGSPEAQYTLGVALEKGTTATITKDQKKAVIWLQRAAQQGHKAAQRELAQLLLANHELPGGYSSAYFWLLVLARGGDKDAAAVAAETEKLVMQEMVPIMKKRAENWQPRREEFKPRIEFTKDK